MCPEPPGTPADSSSDELTVTGIAQHAAWWAKSWPLVEQVRSNVWSVPVPVPDNPIRYTSCYLLSGDGELVVVDPGWDTEPGWSALLAGLAAAGTTVESVTGVVITHIHADHHGMTARLADASGAWVAMHPVERDSLPLHAYPRGTVNSSDARWIAEQGVPPEFADPLRISDDGIEVFRSMAEPTVLLADGELIPLPGRHIRVIWTPGHTPGHLCLHDQDNDVLLTGDHVLPRISPNVGLQPHSSPPPLASYLDSLTKLRDLDSAEVLPAHEWRFRGLAQRIDQLLSHHQERLREILDVMGNLGPCTAWQVTERLTWSRGWDAVKGFQRRAALAETAAHLQYLAQLDRARCSAEPDGATHGSVYSVAG